MADEQKAPDSQGQPVQAPATPEAEKAEVKQEAPSNKFVGKGTEELVKMYSELEKKLGEQSSEVSESRKFREQMDVVLQAIWADKNIYDNIDKKICEMRGVPSETPKELSTQQPVSSVDLDTRRAMENQIISDFERKYGMDQLQPDKKREMNVKIGNALARLADPGGKKTYAEILESISLQNLPSFLGDSYLIANKDDLVEKAKLEALTQRRETEGAAIGSIPSSSGTSSTELTPAEREAAEKLKIAPDKYLERKKQIIKETEEA